MKIEIRRTTKSDLTSVLSLYDGKKSMDEISWVLKDFYGEGFRSFVALNDKNTIIGHIGYIISKYCINDLVFNGMHNMMWIVNEEARGSAGLKLFSKNVKMGDFGFAIGASKFTKKIFPLVKYQYHFDIFQYYKLINPIFFPKFKRGSVSIQKVQNFNFSFDYQNNSRNVFYNLPSKEHLNWILDCPLVQTAGFKIKENGKTIGIVIVYIKTRSQFIRTGRVVHISFLGEDENKWTQTINLINKYFFERKCYLVFFPASYSKLVDELLKCGYKKSSYISKPLYIDNSKSNLPKIKKDNFHLTFLESDLGYRNF